MGFMNYNKIDIDSIKSVKLIPENAEEWIKFKKKMYSKKSKTKGQKEREKYIKHYPEQFRKFKNKYEEIIKNPIAATEQLEENYIGKKRCGNCLYSRKDKYRTGEDYLVCWENSIGKKPKKTTKNHNACERYRTEKIVEKENYRLNLPYILSDLKHSNRLNSTARKIAAFQHLNKVGKFSSMRLKAFLRDLGSTEVKRNPKTNNKNAYLFESKIREKLNNRFNSKNRVIKIEKRSRKPTYKEMDYHGITTITSEKFPFVAEMFTWRDIKRKSSR